MIRAIYRLREDGDYDFVAAFEAEQMPAPPSNWAEEIAEWLRSEGEAVLIVENCALGQLPDIWDGVNERRPQVANTKPSDAQRSP